MAGTDEPVALQLIARTAQRAAWAAESRFEVVLRVTEQGDRYLFALNPDPDRAAEDTVLVADTFSRAIDVSVAGGFPVPVQQSGSNSALRARLGPGEFAAVLLEK